MIHSYQLNGYNIVLDVNSGAVHVLDDLSYQLVNALEEGNIPEKCPEELIERFAPQYDRDKVVEAYGEIYELYCADILFRRMSMKSLRI